MLTDPAIIQLHGQLTEFSELTVSDEQRAESPQTLESFIAILLCDILADGSTGCVDSLGVKLSSLKDEILQQISIVLRQD